MFALLLKVECCTEVKESCMKIVDDLITKNFDEESIEETTLNVQLDVGETVLSIESGAGSCCECVWCSNFSYRYENRPLLDSHNASEPPQLQRAVYNIDCYSSLERLVLLVRPTCRGTSLGPENDTDAQGVHPPTSQIRRGEYGETRFSKEE